MTPFEERQFARERDGKRIYEDLASIPDISPHLKFVAGVVIGNFIQCFGFLDQMVEQMRENNRLLAQLRPTAAAENSEPL